jgi:hypothetical protein
MPNEPAASVQSGEAARLRLVASMGAKAPLQSLLPAFEAQSGFFVDTHYASSQAIAESVGTDADFDVLIVTAAALEVLGRRGVDACATASFGTTLTSLALRPCDPHPGEPCAAALAAIVRHASVISLSDPTRGGSSSRYFLTLADGLGLGETVRRKAMFTGPGEGAVPVSEGRADLGIAQASEIALTPGLVCVPLAGTDPRARSEYLLCLSRRAHRHASGLGHYLLGSGTRDARRANGLTC